MVWFASSLYTTCNVDVFTRLVTLKSLISESNRVEDGAGPLPVPPAALPLPLQGAGGPLDVWEGGGGQGGNEGRHAWLRAPGAGPSPWIFTPNTASDATIKSQYFRQA